MGRKTLDELGYPRTTPEDAEDIRRTAERRRDQMLPGEGPHEPEKEEKVAHYKGEPEEIVLGPVPDALPETEDPDTDPDTD